MSSTKQAKSQGNSGKEPKLHQVSEWRKNNRGRLRLSRGPVLLSPTKEQYVISCSITKQIGSKH